MIKFENVTKIYAGGQKANSNISFAVEPGQALGIVGANGAGKSTLFRQLFGIIRMSEGRITIDGREDIRDAMAYVPQFPVIYPYLKVIESVEFALYYQNIKGNEARRRSVEVLEQLDMADLADQYTYMLSGGQKKKLSFATALVQNKKYLILDEVTSMIDIVSKQQIWDVILKEKQTKGIIISSHDLSEVKNICDHILILKNGEVTYYGGIENIASQVYKVTVKVDDMQALMACLEEMEVDFEYKNALADIYIKDPAQVTFMMEKINTMFTVKYFNCEHPVFYEGVLKYV